MPTDHIPDPSAPDPSAPDMSAPPAQHRVPRTAPVSLWRHGAVVTACVVFVAAMAGATYAAVPFYQLFCQLTGFGGATKVAKAAPARALERTIEVRFDANVAPGLDWSFEPEVRSLQLRIGETKIAYYRVHNRGDRPATAAATYNVTPAQSGYYFAKMQCFCFTDQTLQPGETLDMPVVFFVDPSLAEDPEMAHLKSITLSYTFFPKAAPVAAGTPPAGGTETSKTPL